MIDGGPRQHHGVVVGPFGGVAPPLLAAVPEMAARWIAHNAVWKTLPHGEGKVHLDPEQTDTDTQNVNYQASLIHYNIIS